MLLKLKKELLLKYLFLFVLLFACTAGICSASYIVVITIMICGVVMTSSAFETALTENAKYEGLILDVIFRFSVCGVSVVAIGINKGLTRWYSILIYAIYMFSLSIRLINHFAAASKIDTPKKKKYMTDLQEAAVTLVIPAIYLLSAIPSRVFGIVYYIVLVLFAAAFLVNLRFRRFSKKVMLIFGIVEALILIAVLVFTLTGLFTV
ncbi:MAG: hypothetical protein II135_04810 [Clostridia bacterium]|nr:hypothetical protein [Clostridia bacterium]MBQ3871043.1 hypothetical protein [Clostridia bacterium]